MGNCIRSLTFVHFLLDFTLFSHQLSCSVSRNDRDAAEDKPESCRADHARAVPGGVQLLPTLLDTARGIPALLHTGTSSMKWSNKLMQLIRVYLWSQ